jgi:hypothetical protein
MPKFNRRGTRPAGRGPVQATAAPCAATYEGAPGYVRDAKSELFLLAVTNMAGEDTFYESAGDRDTRYASLVRQIATEDVTWLARFLPWLRGEANMRSAPLIGAAEAVRARLEAGQVGGGRQLVASVLRRADEPAEMLGYWMSRYGRALPKPLKRGVADAVTRVCDERGFLRYDSGARGFRFGDVIELVHPSPRADAAWQGDLFAWAITARHGRDEEPPASLPAVRSRFVLSRLAAEDRLALARRALGGEREAGLAIETAMAGQWEWLLSWLGDVAELTGAERWRLALPHLGYMALARNLRNLDEAGISDELAAALAARIADPEQVKRSRQLPFRFLSAYVNAPSLRWGHALEQALGASLAGVPALGGRTLVLVDTSASMSARGVSARSKVTPVMAGALFGVALAAKGERADLYGFADGVFRHKVRKGASVLRETAAFCDRVGAVGHGTRIGEAVRATYAGHDRVVIVTDMQTFGPARPWSTFGGYVPVTTAAPANVPMYAFNMQGYKVTSIEAGAPNRYEMGGLTDATFRMLPWLEAGRNAGWPWEHAEN